MVSKKVTMEKVQLRIMGRPSKGIIDKFKKALDSDVKQGSGIILFCDYSNYDVPIGQIFNVVKDLGGNVLYSGAISLKKVTQEFLISYDFIPKGHKTICLFEVMDNSIKEILSIIPPIDDWYNSKRVLIFE